MDESYFEEIPHWGESPRFAITADTISARIPVTRIENWRELAELLESSFFNKPKTQYVFRGHRRYDWSLLPTLGRVPANGIVTKTLADQQLLLFRRAVRGRLTDNSLLDESDDTDDELWSVGQHHGLMTPLLDWTYSPYVALFFAFAREDKQGEDDNPYRAIYVLNKTFVADDDKCPDIRVMEPRRDDHGRLVNQAGLFTFSPTDSTIENKLIEVLSENEDIGKDLLNAVEEHDEFVPKGKESEAEVIANYICKIYIRNEDREGCLRALRKMNVHHASLFPDLLGASDYCNLLVEEQYRETEIEAQREQAETEANTKMSADLLNQVATTAFDTSYSAPVESLINLLKTPAESQQVEPGRIEWIASELAPELEKYKLVDWESREAVQAKMRNVVRITLRKLGYPTSARDQVVDKIVETLVGEKTQPKEEGFSSFNTSME